MEWFSLTSSEKYRNSGNNFLFLWLAKLDIALGKAERLFLGVDSIAAIFLNVCITFACKSQG